MASGQDIFNNSIWANYHTTHLFPDDTDLTVTLLAALTAHTWSAWTEIADNEGTKFTTKFASQSGYLTSMVVESLSETDAVYMHQLAYGNDKTEITCQRFAGENKFQNPAHQERFRGVLIPAGEILYYRMKSGTGVADTAIVHFRYYLLPV